MTIVMGVDQHRAQITAEWIDTETGEIARSRVAPAHREPVRRFVARFAGRELEVALEARTGWRFVVEESRCHAVTANVPCLLGIRGVGGGTRGPRVAPDVPPLFREVPCHTCPHDRRGTRTTRSRPRRGAPHQPRRLRRASDPARHATPGASRPHRLHRTHTRRAATPWTSRVRPHAAGPRRHSASDRHDRAVSPRFFTGRAPDSAQSAEQKPTESMAIAFANDATRRRSSYRPLHVEWRDQRPVIAARGCREVRGVVALGDHYSFGSAIYPFVSPMPNSPKRISGEPLKTLGGTSKTTLLVRVTSGPSVSSNSVFPPVPSAAVVPLLSGSTSSRCSQALRRCSLGQQTHSCDS